MSARCSRSLAMVTAWEPVSPTESRSAGLWALAHWMSPCGAGQAQVLVEGLHGLDAQAHLLPDLVAHVDPQVAGGGVFAHPAPPARTGRSRRCRRLRRRAASAGTGTATGWGRPSRRRWWCGRRTGQPGRRRRAGPRASRSSRVSSRKCRVDAYRHVVRPGRGWGWSSRCHSCGMVVSARRCCRWRVAGQGRAGRP